MSAAPEVIDLAASAGLHLDEWQQYVLTHGLGTHEDGRWTANKVSVWVPRQNGKGGIIEALELAWLFLFGEEEVIHTAHQHRTAQKAYERLERIIRGARHLHRKVDAYRQANGEQQIELRDGRKLLYSTRSPTACRGFSTPRLVLDEAQELTADQMAAILPTVSAMDNHQVWFFGTPPNNPAAWAYGLKEDGEAATRRLAHFDWGADLDPTSAEDREKAKDPRIWYGCNPALGIRILEETVEDECKPSGLGEKFPIERLGAWLPRQAAGGGVITPEQWRQLADPQADRPDDVAFALHVNLKRTHAAICYAGKRPDGAMQVGIVDWRAGVGWVVERLTDLSARWNPIAIAVDTRSESLLLDLERAGITTPTDPDHPQRGDLAVPNAAEAAAAFGLFVDAARAGVFENGRWVKPAQLRHPDEGPLTAAVVAGRPRPLAGGQTWDYRSPVEIGPVAAATLAVWAFATREHLKPGRTPQVHAWDDELIREAMA